MIQDDSALTSQFLSGIGAELAVAALADAYPDFDFLWPVYGWRGARWTVRRKNVAHPGLYAIITHDLAEIREALILDELKSARRVPASARAELWASLL